MCIYISAGSHADSQKIRNLNPSWVKQNDWYLLSTRVALGINRIGQELVSTVSEQFDCVQDLVMMSRLGLPVGLHYKVATTVRSIPVPIWPQMLIGCKKKTQKNKNIIDIVHTYLLYNVLYRNYTSMIIWILCTQSTLPYYHELSNWHFMVSPQPCLMVPPGLFNIACFCLTPIPLDSIY